MKEIIQINQKAIFFSLPSTEGEFNLTNYLGKKIILYFYPRDLTPGCTKQAIQFSENIERLEKLNTKVFGISKDSLISHKKFIAKHTIQFPLISDESGKVCRIYQTLKEKSMFGKKYFGIERSTFLINEKGVIIKIWRKVKLASHLNEIINSLKNKQILCN